ncbi:MAG: hypothetical protein IKT08_02005 [Bacteroidales bacterium]|nr:hypothetical protein [Bacteroidales bacterium]
MIRFFRQSYIIQYVVIAMLCIVMWIPSFVTGYVDATWRSPVTPLYNLVADILDFWPYALLLFAFLLNAFEALFFNSILASNQIISKVSTLGAVVFLLMMNLTPAQTTFYPMLLASVFLLMFIHTLFSIYQTQRPELYLFNAGIYLSFASMCYFPSLLLAVWGIIALALIHKGSLRLHLIPFLGILLPYFFYFAVHFLMGDLMPRLQAYVDYFSGLRLASEGFELFQVVLLAFLLLVSAMPLLMPRNYSFEKTVSVRTKVMMTIILLLFGIFMLFLGGDPMQTGVLFIALSVLFSYELAYIDGLRWSNVTFAIFMVAVIFLHYWPLFHSA